MDRYERMMLLLRSPQTSVALQSGLGVSQATISRLLRRVGASVVVMGGGRSTRYQAATEVFGSGYVQPIFEVGLGGIIGQVGELRAFESGGFYVETDSDHWWLRGLSGDGVFESLPYFLFELGPAGFMGRIVARRLAEEWGFPGDPRRWSDSHIGRYLLRRGVDLPGNLLLGESAAQRANEMVFPEMKSREREYPQCVEDVEQGGPVGSSAVGEQPKFTCFDGDEGHLIVKYSPQGTSQASIRRRDLLRAEARALRVLFERCSLDVADCRVYDIEGRVFLESRRFDRIGVRGRCASISMTMVDAEYTGEGQGWTRVGAALHENGLLSSEDLSAIARAETFGHWIGNNDMHLGNLSLQPVEGRFALLPVYDMSPMAFAPRDESLPEVTLRPPLRTSHNEHCWEETRIAGEHFFQSIADDPSFSDDFRKLSASRSRALEGC